MSLHISLVLVDRKLCNEYIENKPIYPHPFSASHPKHCTRSKSKPLPVTVLVPPQSKSWKIRAGITRTIYAVRRTIQSHYRVDPARFKQKTSPGKISGTRTRTRVKYFTGIFQCSPSLKLIISSISKLVNIILWMIFKSQIYRNNPNISSEQVPTISQ